MIGVSERKNGDRSEALLGAPGVGKGTYASRLCPLLKMDHIAAGDLIRDEIKGGTAIGKEVKAIAEAGKLVPDELVTGLVADHLERGVPDRPLFVLAHSMGALLALLLLDRDPRFHGAILNGTPYRIPDHIARSSRVAAQILGGVLPWLPLQRFFDATRATSDPAIHAEVLADPLIYKGWMRAGTGKALLGALSEAHQVVPGLRVPLLITHGGIDRTVPMDASARLHAASGSPDKELHVFDGLLHEVHNEPDRDVVIGRWATWMKRRVKG